MLNLERKIWIIIGTRPELIKQLPVYNECVKRFGKKNVHPDDRCRNIPSKIDDRKRIQNGILGRPQNSTSDVGNFGAVSRYSIKLIVVTVVLIITPLLLLILFALDHTNAHIFSDSIIPYGGISEIIITLAIFGGIYLTARKFGFGRFT